MKKTTSDLKGTIIFNLLIGFGILSRLYSSDTSTPPALQKAYLDPGTGSMIISAIIGIFATGVLAFKTMGYKIVRLFRPKSGTPEKKSAGGPPEKS